MWLTACPTHDPGAVWAPDSTRQMSQACAAPGRASYRWCDSVEERQWEQVSYGVQMSPNSATDKIPPDDAQVVLTLRLLIARAANKDSLSWWDDESLTPHAGFLLERIFPIAPPLAARSLALSAATARHQAACAHDNALHLYRLDLDSQDTLVLRSVPLLSIPLPQEPLPSIDALKGALLDLLGRPMLYTSVRRTEAGGLEIEIPPTPPGVSMLLHRAQTLAWAYLEGGPNEPVFPFCLE